MREVMYGQAFNKARREEMARDKRVFIMGEDIQNTRDLVEEFGLERVRGCPISESAFVGASVGAALAGMRPIVWMMFGTFVYVAMDQFANQMGKIRYMSGGEVELPIVVWVPDGGRYVSWSAALRPAHCYILAIARV